MFVFFPNEDKVGVKTIKTYAERMKSEGVNRALMVVQANLTPFAKQAVGEMHSKYHMEVVSIDPCDPKCSSIICGLELYTQHCWGDALNISHKSCKFAFITFM